MQTRPLAPEFAVAAQLSVDDIQTLAAQGVRTLICNRPDGEAADQPTHRAIGQAATAAGLVFHYLPTVASDIRDTTVLEFAAMLEHSPGPVVAYCRSGTRAAMLWALSQVGRLSLDVLVQSAARADVDLTPLLGRLAALQGGGLLATPVRHQVVIVGAGSAGIATAASLKAREDDLDIVIIDPAEVHYYQPGWTLVGAGVFDVRSTVRPMASVIPPGVKWIKASVAAFDPAGDSVILASGQRIGYEQLIVCPGLKLDWEAIDGLPQALGKHGVTSNYRYDLAPYTWQLVTGLKEGRALFTQPPMPIKCAGAPQKALYLSCDHWLRNGLLGRLKAHFFNAGGVLFGVPDYVPALMEYIEKYAVEVSFSHKLVAVDGPGQTATFLRTGSDGSTTTVVEPFDMLHVVPPQVAPDFIRNSPLADSAGWLDVDPQTLRHKRFANIHALGDAINTSNAKTMAAARQQAPVVAANVLVGLGLRAALRAYQGYGSCPLTVERGKIVLAEFVYGGKLAPTFPRWLLDGCRPTRMAWWLKERILPPFYWHCMLKGREWFASAPALAAEAQP